MFAMNNNGADYVLDRVLSNNITFEKIEHSLKITESDPTDSSIRDLKTLCLDCIADNMETFATAFSVSKDPTLQRNLQFLQRRYSDFCLTQTLRPSVDEAHLEFAVHEFLKEIDLELLEGCSPESIRKKMSEIGHVFEKVSYAGDPPSIWETTNCEFVEDMLPYFSNLTALRLCYACRDETLEVLALSCPNLKELTIKNCPITDAGLKHLCGKGGGKDSEENSKALSLTKLCISNCDLVDQGIECILENMPSLEILEYPTLPDVLLSLHVDNVDCGLRGSGKYNLAAIDLSYVLVGLSNINEYLATVSVLCPHIKKLTTSVFSPNDVEYLCNYLELEEASISGAGEFHNVDSFLKRAGKSLKKLKLGRTTISPDLLLQCCENLQTLFLDCTVLNSPNKVVTSKMTHMKMIILIGYDLGMEVCRERVGCILKACPNLEYLYFFNCVGFRDHTSSLFTFFSEYCEKSALTQMRFVDCKVHFNFYRAAMEKCSALRSLGISDPENSDDFVRLQQISAQQNVTMFFCPDMSDFSEMYYDDYSDYGFDDFQHAFDDEVDNDYEDFFLDDDDDEEEYDIDFPFF